MSLGSISLVSVHRGINHYNLIKTATPVHLDIFVKSLVSGYCFGFRLIFSHFQTGVAYKSIAYKHKSCNHQRLKELAILITHSAKCVNTIGKWKNEAHI